MSVLKEWLAGRCVWMTVVCHKPPVRIDVKSLNLPQQRHHVMEVAFIVQMNSKITWWLIYPSLAPTSHLRHISEQVRWGLKALFCCFCTGQESSFSYVICNKWFRLKLLLLISVQVKLRECRLYWSVLAVNEGWRMSVDVASKSLIVKTAPCMLVTTHLILVERRFWKNNCENSSLNKWMLFNLNGNYIIILF